MNGLTDVKGLCWSCQGTWSWLVEKCSSVSALAGFTCWFWVTLCGRVCQGKAMHSVLLWAFFFRCSPFTFFNPCGNVGNNMQENHNPKHSNYFKTCVSNFSTRLCLHCLNQAGFPFSAGHLAFKPLVQTWESLVLLCSPMENCRKLSERVLWIHSEVFVPWCL